PAQRANGSCQVDRRGAPYATAGDIAGVQGGSSRESEPRSRAMVMATATGEPR
ncbi:unnamed protein product, partial [Urochloa humidicola]